MAALVIGVAGVLVFVAIGFIAYPRLIARANARELLRHPSVPVRSSDPESASAVPTSRPTPAIAATPRAPVSVATPANPEGVATKPVPPPSSPAAHAAPPAPPRAATTTVGGGDAFKAWVDGVKISGVRIGRSPRVLIGARAYDLGDTVDEALGITFDGYDDTTHLVRFRDRTGRILQRRDR